MAEGKIIEQEIADDLRELLKRGISELKSVSGEFEAGDVVKLEKLTRIYAVLMTDTRETLKHGLLSSLSDADLDELAEES